jgi:hypothetical protein
LPLSSPSPHSPQLHHRHLLLPLRQTHSFTAAASPAPSKHSGH